MSISPRQPSSRASGAAIEPSIACSPPAWAPLDPFERVSFRCRPVAREPPELGEEHAELLVAHVIAAVDGAGARFDQEWASLGESTGPNEADAEHRRRACTWIDPGGRVEADGSLEAGDWVAALTGQHFEIGRARQGLGQQARVAGLLGQDERLSSHGQAVDSARRAPPFHRFERQQGLGAAERVVAGLADRLLKESALAVGAVDVVDDQVGQEDQHAGPRRAIGNRCQDNSNSARAARRSPMRISIRAPR